MITSSTITTINITAITTVATTITATPTATTITTTITATTMITTTIRTSSFSELTERSGLFTHTPFTIVPRTPIPGDAILWHLGATTEPS